MEQLVFDPRRLAVRYPVDTWKNMGINLALISLGSLIFVIGMNSILLPQQFLTGGITGLAMILHYWLDSLDVGVMYFFFNIPLIILGWFSISRRFMMYTLFGMVFFSMTTSKIHLPAADIRDPFLAAIFAGAICGVGGGLILRSVGSAGGFDIVGIFIHQKFGIRPGVVIFFINLIPLGIGAYLFSLEMALYSAVFMFISARVIDQILSGFNQRKSLLIISNRTQEIAEYILSEKHRGVTLLKGEGAYTGKERDVILTVTILTEVPRIKETIFAIDPDAFVVVNDTLEVLGRYHGKLKVY